MRERDENIKRSLEYIMNRDVIKSIAEYDYVIDGIMKEIVRGNVVDSIVIGDKIAYISEQEDNITIIDPKNLNNKRILRSENIKEYGKLFLFPDNILVLINPVEANRLTKTVINFYFLNTNINSEPDFVITDMEGLVSNVLKVSETEYCFDGNNIEIWDIQERKLKYVFTGLPFMKSMILLPNNKIAINSIGSTSKLEILDLNTRTQTYLNNILPQTQYMYRLFLLKNNKIIALGGDY